MASTSTGNVKVSDTVYDAISKQLARTRKLEVEATVPEVIETLTKVQAIDLENEALRKKYGFRFGFGLAFSILFLVLAIPTVGITLLVAVPLIVYSILQYGHYSKAKKLDVINRKHRIPIQLLQSLGKDIHPLSPIGLNVDFNHYLDVPSYKKSGDGGLFATIKSSKYEQDWLELKGELMDGTRFRLRISTNIKRKEKAKRKSTKVTETFKEKTTLMILPAPERYSIRPEFEPYFKQAFDQTKNLAKFVSTFKTNVTSDRVVIQTLSNPSRRMFFDSRSDSPFDIVDAKPALDLFRAAYAALLFSNRQQTGGPNV